MFANVTLEATPRIAEKIAVAQSLGQLSLSLRSIADSTAELERAVASGEVKVPAGTNATEERKMMLAIASQPIDSGTTYTTGGDVSRFQRRTVPAKTAQVSAPVPSAAPPVIVQPAGGGAAPANMVPIGPVVRVARGNDISIVPVGAR